MKVIIWGHKLYTHTHSFIHYGFFKAFNSMGYNTYWFDDNDDVSKFNFKDCLFLTEGQVCKNMPIRKDCKYILHNVCNPEITNSGIKFITIQVYNKDCLNLNKINDYTFYEGGCLYQPWATDLLPNEIDLSFADIPKDKSIYFIGTITTGWNDIVKECAEFERAAKTKNIDFIREGGGGRYVKNEDSIKRIKSSYCAPIFQSVKQRGIKYIPCRIFKNISYGQYPVTNCEHLQFLFPGNVVFNEDTYKLFFEYDVKKNKKLLKEMMQEVKEKHTFINRINQILEIL